MTQVLDHRQFPAKLLLFGEHVLLLGAQALAVPVNTFGGHWSWGKEKDRHHARMLQFAQSESLGSLKVIDTDQFRLDLQSGLYFQSDIPTGYGLGSSGALCAAVYDRYARVQTEDLAELKLIFARMEGFFHGNSSGIDPLTSFVGEPILIREKTMVQRTKAPIWNTGKPILFLLDSGLPRRTGPLVDWFLAQSQEAIFSKKLKEDYFPAHEATLNGWLSGNFELFWPNLRRVSAFQLEHFVPMIPRTLERVWEQSFEKQDISLKICGAGGGGFVLGFAKDIMAVQNLTETFRVLFPQI